MRWSGYPLYEASVLVAHYIQTINEFTFDLLKSWIFPLKLGIYDRLGFKELSPHYVPAVILLISKETHFLELLELTSGMTSNLPGSIEVLKIFLFSQTLTMRFQVSHPDNKAEAIKRLREGS